MAKTKKLTSQLLALFMAAVLVFSNFGSVAAVADTAAEGTDCGIADYKETGALTNDDKSDATQANTQTTNLTENEGYCTNLLLQSAKWTNKSDGEAKLNIHYTADFDTDTTATRSLYIFTTCNKHGFTEKIAIENIIELLEYNDYVDVIMIGATNYSKGGDDNEATEVGAVLMFTLKADDFVDIEDGATYLSVDGDNVTTYTDTSNTATKASIIKAILETYTNAALISSNTKAHVLGCATDDNCSCSDPSYYKECTDGDTCTDDAYDDTHYYDGYASSYGPYIEVLFDSVTVDEYSAEGGYKFGDYGTYFTSAAALGLTFQPASHVGGLFSLYYIAEYIDIIETNYGSGSFSSTVENILNSFDAFVVADKNLPAQNVTTVHYTTNTLYGYVKEYIGLDLTAENMDLSDMESTANGQKCLEALSVIHEYNAANRYISLIPYDEIDQTGDALGFETRYTKYKDDNTTTEDLNTAINTIFYCLALICPTDDILDEAASLAMIKTWIEGYAEEKDVYDELLAHNDNIHTYTYNLKELELLAEVSKVENSVTITATIDSDFKITDANEITVVNSGVTNSSFDYEITSVDADDDGNTVVTIEFTNLSTDTYDNEGNNLITSDDWVIDMSILVNLKEGIADFYTTTNEGDWFKDTNGSDDAITTATVTRTVTRANDMVQTYTEKVTVDSPQLYKAPPILSIVKTSDVASAKVGETVNYTLTVIQTEADATATDVVVTDTIPEGLSYVNGSVAVIKDNADITSNVTVSYDKESGVLKIEGLGDLSTETITITYDVTAESGYEGKTLTNFVTAEAGNADKVDDSYALTIQDAEDEPEEEASSGNTDPDGSTTGDGDDGDTTGGGSGDASDDANADEADDDTSTSSTLPKTGDYIGALFPIIALVALGAFAIAVLAAFALRRRRIH